MTTYLGQNPVLLHPLVESLEQAIKALIITDDYIGQTASASFPATGYLLDYVYMAAKNRDLLIADLGYTLIFTVVSAALIGGLKLGKAKTATA